MHHGREVGRRKNLTHHHFNLASCVLLVNFFFVPPADDMCFVSISFLFPSFLATILPSAALALRENDHHQLGYALITLDSSGFRTCEPPRCQPGGAFSVTALSVWSRPAVVAETSRFSDSDRSKIRIGGRDSRSDDRCSPVGSSASSLPSLPRYFGANMS